MLSPLEFLQFLVINCFRISRNRVLLMLLVAGSASAGELLPYDPPRAANPAYQGSNSKGTAGPPSQSVAMEHNFIRDAQRLSAQERTRLATDLRGLQQQAVRDRQWDAAKYYDRLLSLLNGRGQ